MSIKYVVDGLEPGNKSYTIYRPWNSNQTEYARKLSIVAPDTAQSLFIYNVNTKESIELKLIPNSMSESYSSRIVKESGIYGRVRPLNFYTGGGGKTLSFSFDLHEDLNSIDGSLYKLLDTLKDMSKPTFNGNRGLIQEPIVYLQFGDQFAGKGHINSDYTLNKPYRKDISRGNGGRYAFANVSITFTFHEEFEQSQYLISDEGELAISSYSIDLQKAYDNFLSERYGDYASEYGISMEDFIELVTANQYYITQSFTSEKLLGGFLNSVKINANDKKNPKLYEELMKLAETGQRVDGGLVYQYSYGQLNEITAAVFNFYVDLSNILSNDMVLVNKLEAVTNYYNIVFAYYNDIVARINQAKATAEGSVLRIQNTSGISSVNTIFISIEDADKAVLEIQQLLGIIFNQKFIYQSMMSAGN